MNNKLLFLAMCLVCGCGQTSPPAPIYLGHIATTSGSGRLIGEKESLGIRLAIEELSRTGQDRVGDRPVFVKHSDAVGQLDAMESQAVRLVSLSRVIGIYGGNTPEEVQRLDRSRVPVLTPLGTLPRGVTELVYATGISLSSQAYALARFAFEEKGMRNMLLLIDDRREEAQALAEAFEREFQKASEEKNAKEKLGPLQRITFGKDATFPELATRIVAAKVQGVLFAGNAQDYEEWRKAIPTPDFAVFFGGEDGTLREAGPHAAFLASAFAIDKDLPKTAAFAQQFQETFKEAADVHAALAYDGIRIFIDALRRMQPPVGERFLEELRRTKDFPGLTGPLTFNSDQQILRPVFVGRMAGPVFTAIKRYDPRKS